MKSIPKKYKIMNNFEFSFNNLSAYAVQPSDIEEIRKWRNSQIDILRQSNFISKEKQIKYFEENIWGEFDKDCPKTILLSIYHERNFVAYGGLVNISWEDKRAEVSFVAATEIASNEKKYLNLFSKYLSLIQFLGFSELNFNRLFTETYDIRSKHIHTLEQSGFNKEGTMKSHVFINGVFKNSLIHGVLRDDYLKNC